MRSGEELKPSITSAESHLIQTDKKCLWLLALQKLGIYVSIGEGKA